MRFVDDLDVGEGHDISFVCWDEAKRSYTAGVRICRVPLYNDSHAPLF